MPVVDASVYVAIVNKLDVHHATCRRWYEAALNDGQSLYAPTILLGEVAAAVSRGVDDVGLALEVTALLAKSSVIDLVPVASTLAESSAEIAARQRIRSCDAIYVALAQALGKPLVTLDRQQLARAQTLIAVASP